MQTLIFLPKKKRKRVKIGLFRLLNFYAKSLPGILRHEDLR